jgi:hypothetical protein
MVCRDAYGKKPFYHSGWEYDPETYRRLDISIEEYRRLQDNPP